MQVYRGAYGTEVRLEPLSKKNRARMSANSEEFAEVINEDMFSPQKISRRGDIRVSLSLEYVFWEIAQDPYVAKARANATG